MQNTSKHYAESLSKLFGSFYVFVDVPRFRSRLVCLVRLIIGVMSSEGIILHYQNTLLSTTSKIPHVIVLFD